MAVCGDILVEAACFLDDVDPSARTGADAADLAACSAWYAAVVARLSSADMCRHIMGGHVFGLPEFVIPLGMMRLPNASYAYRRPLESRRISLKSG